MVLVAFGQSDKWQFEETARLCNKFDHAFVANYSRTDLRRHSDAGASEDKSRLIRFAKYPGDFKPWTGNIPRAYAACNSIHLRGPGCAWDLFSQVMQRCPVVLSGVKTEDVGGLGQVPVGRMHELFQTSACSVSFGTMPAAMTLAQIEAVCAGCPLVIWDNNHGCRDEGLTRMVHGTVESIVNDINMLISGEEYRRQRHEESLEAAEMFNVKNVRPLWEELLERVME